MEGSSQCNESLTELLNDWDNDAEPFPFEEATIEEVMQEFYKEIVASPNKPPSPPPLPSPLLSETETGSVVVELPVGAGSDEFVGAKVGEENEIEMEIAEEDFDDEWLATMLSWGQLVDSTEWF